MWQGRRRLERLEKEVAQARTAQADLQRRLDMFEKIAAAAGAALDDPALHAAAIGAATSRQPAPLQPVPPTLLAAAQESRRKASPVRLAVAGEDFIAVIGEEGGDPREWWAAIYRLASRPGSAS